ncbi:MAG: site-specific recombinase [Burkholderiaceae bacterium]|jgi:site-specific recombinase|nr:site-specific recombinase [Burkholderiaceae bacterium]
MPRDVPVVQPRLRDALAAFVAAERAVDAGQSADALALFTALFDAIRPRRREPPEFGAARFGAVVEAVAADAALARAMRRPLLHLLGTRRLVSFFADSGILPTTGFFSELGRIVSQRLLPDLPDERDLRGCMQRVFHARDDWAWLQTLPAETTQRFWLLLAVDDGVDSRDALRHVADQMIEALLVLAYRIGGIGVEQEFGRLGPRFVAHAPRMRGLARVAQQFADGLRAHWHDDSVAPVDEAELLVMTDQCHEVLDDAQRACLQQGTSLALTFLIRRTRQSLRRIETLARLVGIGVKPQADRATRAQALTAWGGLVGDALRAENQRNSLREHLSKGMALLALRVTDNAAKTGEHYIAATRAEYAGMWRAAAGAGLIIAAMALTKIFASTLSLAPIGVALSYSLIYGLGFVVIYMLHMTIATKQPAMTAQTIAGYLGEASNGRVADLERVVDLIAAVARSQLAAILGNVLVALPTAMAIAVLWQARTGAMPFGEHKAMHLLHDLDPLGWAVPHAALAGVFLFAAGLLSGYFDNKASYARIGARIGRLHWLAAAVGAARAQRVGRYVEDHLGGLMGNFLFGCMLGSAGTIGLILGLPIDIRHIAFASANLGYALTVLEFALPWQAVAWAALGVALIGLTNLGVSFALALWMALRARGIVFTQWRELLRRLLWRIRLQPSSFIVPRRDLEAGAAPH